MTNITGLRWEVIYSRTLFSVGPLFSILIMTRCVQVSTSCQIISPHSWLEVCEEHRSHRVIVCPCPAGGAVTSSGASACCSSSIWYFMVLFCPPFLLMPVVWNAYWWFLVWTNLNVKSLDVKYGAGLWVALPPDLRANKNHQHGSSSLLIYKIYIEKMSFSVHRWFGVLHIYRLLFFFISWSHAFSFFTLYFRFLHWRCIRKSSRWVNN